jgi:hypothetical protein
MNNWNTTSYSNWNNKKNNKNYYTGRYSAGILPYTYNLKGQCLFLLGKDHDGDWSDFGGRCEFKDKNDPINTASREFYEETLGSVIDISDCIEKLRNGEPVKIVSKTLNGSPYYMFLLYVDYNNYTDNFNKTSNFLKYHYYSLHQNNNINKVIEKNTIRWVTIDTLMNCIESKQNPISLRGVFYKTIKNCIDQIIILNK